MDPVRLTSMMPAQECAWGVLLDLSADFRTDWCLIGGQMVWLFAQEHGIEPVQATEDVDIAVDIQADQGAIKRLCAWLETRDFKLEGVSPDGIGHRYVSSTYEGPGDVLFDVLRQTISAPALTSVPLRLPVLSRRLEPELPSTPRNPSRS